MSTGIDGQRFDQWTQTVARKLSRGGSTKREDPTRLAGGICAYPDLTTVALGQNDQGPVPVICGWEHPSAVPASNGDSPPARTGRPARRQRARPLSAREREVAALIARGLRDREIAAALVLSEHTVHAHVRNLLDKLGLASRAQIAAWVATPAPDEQTEP